MHLTHDTTVQPGIVYLSLKTTVDDRTGGRTVGGLTTCMGNEVVHGEVSMCIHFELYGESLTLLQQSRFRNSRFKMQATTNEKGDTYISENLSNLVNNFKGYHGQDMGN